MNDRSTGRRLRGAIFDDVVMHRYAVHLFRSNKCRIPVCLIKSDARILEALYFNRRWISIPTLALVFVFIAPTKRFS